MKIKLSLILFIGFVLFRGSAIANNYNTLLPKNIKLIGTLKDAKGNELGKVYIGDFEYIEFFKADIFRKLIIKSTKNGITNTLYSVNNCLFTNPKGTDITISEKKFNGYKIEFLQNDSIQLFAIGDKKTGAGASDPITIQWNYKKSCLKFINRHIKTIQYYSQYRC